MLDLNHLQPLARFLTKGLLTDLNVNLKSSDRVSKFDYSGGQIEESIENKGFFEVQKRIKSHFFALRGGKIGVKTQKYDHLPNGKCRIFVE
jgi:hypothetical protein